MKLYEKPMIFREYIEQYDIICSSNPNDRHNKPGWGPDKDSDGDGHDYPPGQHKHAKYNDCFYFDDDYDYDEY